MRFYKYTYHFLNWIWWCSMDSTKKHITFQKFTAVVTKLFISSSLNSISYNSKLNLLACTVAKFAVNLKIVLMWEGLFPCVFKRSHTIYECRVVTLCIFILLSIQFCCLFVKKITNSRALIVNLWTHSLTLITFNLLHLFF